MSRTTTTLMTATATLALLGSTGCTGFLAASAEDPSPSDSASEATAEPMSDQEVLAAIDEAAAELDDLAADMTIATETGMGRQEATFAGEGAADFSDGRYTAGSDEFGIESETEIYFDESGIYTNEDGRGWYETYGSTGGAEDTSYVNVVSALTSLEDLVEVEHDGGTYTLSHTGGEEAVFEAFESPFSLTLEGTEAEQTTMTLHAEVDAETMHLTELSFSVEAGPAGVEETMTLSVDITYSAFDEIGPVEIPQEVLDEARP